MRDRKIFHAVSVHLSSIPSCHKALNGSKQKNVLIKCRTKKQFAEIVECSTAYLRTYCLLQESRKKEHRSIVKKTDTIYYQPEHTVTGFDYNWYELKQESPPCQ